MPGPANQSPQIPSFCQTMMIGRSGSGHSPARERSAAGRTPGGRFSQTGSLERAVRGGALRDELPPVTCHPIHTPWLCECGPPIKLARKETDRTSPSLAGLLSSPAEGHVVRRTGNGPLPAGHLEAGFPKPGPWNVRFGAERSGMSCLQ